MESVTLRRRVLPRIRTTSALDWLAWLVSIVGVLAVPHTLDDGNVAAPLFAFLGIACRLAIATESAHCDADGVTWRTVFLRRSVPWEHVAGIEIDPLWSPFSLTRPRLVSHRCLVVATADGTNIAIKPSIWCRLDDQLRFIADARTISPFDWADVADGLVAAPRRVTQSRRNTVPKARRSIEAAGE